VRADTARADSGRAGTVPTDSVPADTVRADTARADSALAHVPGADTLRPTRPTRHLPGPGGTFLRSLLVPGWGQLRVHRPITAAFFVATEALTLGMSLKYNAELRDARQLGDSALIFDKTNKREDWLVLLGVNHLLAGLEAYVSAHLVDFPDDLKLRAVPGGVAGQVALPVLR
jgi:hypothetical protein